MRILITSSLLIPYLGLLLALSFYGVNSSSFQKNKEANRYLATINHSPKLIIFHIEGLSSKDISEGLGNSFIIQLLYKKREFSEFDFFSSDYVQDPWDAYVGENTFLKSLGEWGLEEATLSGLDSESDSVRADFIRLQNFLSPYGKTIDKHFSLFKSFNSFKEGILPGTFPKFRQTYYMAKTRFFRELERENLPKVSLFRFSSLKNTEKMSRKEFIQRVQSIEKMIVASTSYLYDQGFQNELVTLVVTNKNFHPATDGNYVLKSNRDQNRVSVEYQGKFQEVYLGSDEVELLSGGDTGPFHVFENTKVLPFDKASQLSHQHSFPDWPTFLKGLVEKKKGQIVRLAEAPRDTLLSKLIFIGEPIDPIKARGSLRSIERFPRSIDLGPTIQELFFLEGAKDRDPSSDGHLKGEALDIWE